MNRIETKAIVYSKIVQDEPLIPPGKRGYKVFPIQVESAKEPGYYILINLRVKQSRSKRDDIRFYIFDSSNYEIWLKMLEAIDREEKTYAVPNALVNVPRVVRGEFQFKPPSNGTYYVVFSNRHSFMTAKSVTVEITEVWYEIPSKKVQELETVKVSPPTPVEQETSLVSPQTKEYVERQLQAYNWKPVLRELDRAEMAYNDGRMADCCNNLKSGLITLLTKVYENLENRPCPIQPGKSVDISPVISSLINHRMAEDAAKGVNRTWSFVSERAHIEKRGGAPPSEPDTLLSLQQTFATVEYLLRFIG